MIHKNITTIFMSICLKLTLKINLYKLTYFLNKLQSRAQIWYVMELVKEQFHTFHFFISCLSKHDKLTSSYPENFISQTNLPSTTKQIIFLLRKNRGVVLFQARVCLKVIEWGMVNRIKKICFYQKKTVTWLQHGTLLALLIKYHARSSPQGLHRTCLTLLNRYGVTHFDCFDLPYTYH